MESPIPAPPPPPSKEDIQLLRAAFAEFYGLNRDLPKSEQLLNQAIDRWQNQPADERAGLYRVRGDCYMAAAERRRRPAGLRSGRAAAPEGPGAARPTPIPRSCPRACWAARAPPRCWRSPKDSPQQQRQWAARSAEDYRRALQLGSREDWDTDAERLEDGAAREPVRRLGVRRRAPAERAVPGGGRGARPGGDGL